MLNFWTPFIIRPDSSNTPLIITEQWKRIQLAVLFAKYWNIIWSLKWWIIKWDQEKMVAAWSWRRIMFLLEFPFSFFSFLCFGLSGFPLVLVHKRKEKKRSLKLRYIICKLFCGVVQSMYSNFWQWEIGFIKFRCSILSLWFVLFLLRIRHGKEAPGAKQKVQKTK